MNTCEPQPQAIETSNISTMQRLAEVHRDHDLHRISPKKISILQECSEEIRSTVIRHIFAIRPIEEFWKTAYSVLTNNQDYFGLRVDNSEESLQRALGRCSDDIWQLTSFLQCRSVNTIKFLSVDWMKLLSRPDGFETKMSIDRWELMAGMDESLVIQNFHSVLAAGFTTATMQMWKILASIPTLYERAHGEAVQPELFSTIARNSLPTVLALSTSQMRVLANFDFLTGALMDPLSDPNPEFRELLLERELYPHLELQGQGDRQRIDITQACANTINGMSFHSAPRYYIGCPASHAKGPTSRSVVTEMYMDWVIPMAEKLVIPRILGEGA